MYLIPCSISFLTAISISFPMKVYIQQINMYINFFFFSNIQSYTIHYSCLHSEKVKSSCTSPRICRREALRAFTNLRFVCKHRCIIFPYVFLIFASIYLYLHVWIYANIFQYNPEWISLAVEAHNKGPFLEGAYRGKNYI